jgi:hypothetical protein
MLACPAGSKVSDAEGVRSRRPYNDYIPRQPVHFEDDCDNDMLMFSGCGTDAELAERLAMDDAAAAGEAEVGANLQLRTSAAPAGNCSMCCLSCMLPVAARQRLSINS